VEFWLQFSHCFFDIIVILKIEPTAAPVLSHVGQLPRTPVSDALFGWRFSIDVIVVGIWPPSCLALAISVNCEVVTNLAPLLFA